MKDKRLPGQSQLDYLWSTYKYYVVSNELENPQEEYIPTQALVTKLLKDLEVTKTEVFEVVDSLPVLGDPNKIYVLNIDDNYFAYIYVDNLAVQIGGTDSDLAKKVEYLNTEIDNIKNQLNWKEF